MDAVLSFLCLLPVISWPPALTYHSASDFFLGFKILKISLCIWAPWCLSLSSSWSTFCLSGLGLGRMWWGERLNHFMFTNCESPTNTRAWWASSRGRKGLDTTEWLTYLLFNHLMSTNCVSYTMNVDFKTMQTIQIGLSIMFWLKTFLHHDPPVLSGPTGHGLVSLSYTRLWSMWSDWLVFCDYGFSVSALWCPLATLTILVGFLLPWTWGISSGLLQQSTATAPYLGRGVSP